MDRMLASKEIKALVIALGAAIGDTFNIEKLRYHKIIIATDADVDGSHIRTLLLTLFYRYYQPLVEAGYIYIALPPLYKIKKGKEIFYAYTEKEKEDIVGTGVEVINEVTEGGEGEAMEGQKEKEDEKPASGGKEKTDKKLSVQRYKGLGEMNADELWGTTMNPATRVLKRVGIGDAEEADKIFEILMGNEVAPRKAFIQNNATLANLDI